jgi:hypothetical protein
MSSQSNDANHLPASTGNAGQAGLPENARGCLTMQSIPAEWGFFPQPANVPEQVNPQVHFPVNASFLAVPPSPAPSTGGFWPADNGPALPLSPRRTPFLPYPLSGAATTASPLDRNLMAAARLVSDPNQALAFLTAMVTQGGPAHAPSLRATSRSAGPAVGLQSLPTEIRLQIYKHVFDTDIALNVNKRAMRTCDPNDPLCTYRLMSDVDAGLIRTCRLFRAEALPIVNAATWLYVEDTFERQDPLEHIPDAFLLPIEKIKVEFDAFTHINRRRLPSLKRVHLFMQVEAPAGFDDVIHVINCPNCGGTDRIMEKSMGGILSWEWKQRQFAYLAEEEGWNLKMTVLWTFPASVQVGIVRPSFFCTDIPAYTNTSSVL